MVLATLGLLLPMQALAADNVLDRKFPYQASQVQVNRVVADLGRSLGIVVRLDDGIDGVVTLRNVDGTVADVLNDATAQVGATWWYDGAVAHLEWASDTTNAFVNPRGLTRAYINREMESLGLRDTRFALWATADEGVIRVSGPRGYVEQVVALIGTLIEVRNARAGGAETTGYYIPRIYHGRLAGS